MEKNKEIKNRIISMFSDKHLNKSLGDMGEKIAEKYLMKNGYKVIKKNYRIKFDEIDIITKEKNGKLVFIEVKAKYKKENRSEDYNSEDNFTNLKLKRISRICEMFVAKHRKMIFKDVGWRIDLVTITIFESGKIRIRHYKNVG